MRVLFDTCVVMDVLQRREPFWVDAYAAFFAVANRRAQGFLTAKSFTDIYYLTHRTTHDKSETRKILTSLLITFDLLDTSAFDCRKALLSDGRDYEDAVMMETAARSGMDRIITRNVRDYRQSSVPVVLPSEFMEQLSH